MTTLTRTAEDLIHGAFSRIPKVTYVYTEHLGNAFNVTIVIDDFDDNDLAAVLEAEWQLMRECKECEFTFDVIYQHGRPISELIAPMPPPLYQRA
jgi:hypothetical protein